MKKSICFSFLLFFPLFLFSQVRINQNKIPNFKNEVGIELGGNCLFYSVYYQRTLYKKNKFQFNLRIGTSVFPSFSTGSLLKPTNPVRIGAYILPNALMFRKRHAWEMGLASSIITSNIKDTRYDYTTNTYVDEINKVQLFFLTPQIGYRAYLKNNKMYFRAMVSSMFLMGTHQSSKNHETFKPNVLPWGGIGIGYCFGTN